MDQAAFFNAVLVRYPDLLDTYLTVGGLCHPADNFGAILAVADTSVPAERISCWPSRLPMRSNVASAHRFP